VSSPVSPVGCAQHSSAASLVLNGASHAAPKQGATNGGESSLAGSASNGEENRRQLTDLYFAPKENCRPSLTSIGVTNAINRGKTCRMHATPMGAAVSDIQTEQPEHAA
jgi:hypothetical protein